MKELSSIAWDVPESEYRNDSALSYSTLSRYEREGRFNALPTLFDKQSTPSLIFGSMVDTLITGSEEDFNESFIAVEDPNISDNLKEITLRLVDMYKESNTSFDDIPDSVLSQVGKEQDFWANDKYNNYRAKLIRENCKSFYSVLMLSQGKTVVSTKDIEDARRCVNTLKNSEITKNLFADNDPFDTSVRRYYQLKFKNIEDNTGVEYRNMADLILVDYVNKIIYPYDLKTSSHNEWEFPKSFIKYRYDLQARLYWRNIRKTLDKDEYFKDFKLMDYTFIVINRNNCKPLLWNFDQTQCLGEIRIHSRSGYNYTLRDPYVIGKELNDYLTTEHEYPIDIQPVNSITKYIENN